jgi:hypothetical protein
MIITKPNGEIIYFSPLRVGAHDQSHWNELNLREWFKQKEYGIMGDRRFTFNCQFDDDEIIGVKPIKKKKGMKLQDDEKIYNKKLSETCVVVENSIRRIKMWKILAGTYRHWRLGQGQIQRNDILTVCVTLANRQICKSPPRKPDWLASDWETMLNLPPPTPPIQIPQNWLQIPPV